ncbi:helix-turn-helix transcriptional regulator [Streptomyces tubbatahanensis]|uniref:Helix-turn-helix transcriptional regulator n=1 Tax=Streptomyces tubbatahanensis TaxID=2923272 RepID=A0ABY3XZZ2_9ACTN|nr:helix-turn-helix transcriptional regulator [Streptomyces tubbatahanensis]UNS99863.1 helix-turn-helix transcriptional regulator [Streptomyces tubbatahanensis]
MTAEQHVDGNPKADPKVSTLAYFGTELRIRREEAGLSQTTLGRRTFCTHSYVSRIESGSRVPSEEFAQRCDDALCTGGLFARLWPVVIEHAYPDWFRPFVDLEKDATEVWNFQNQVAPGLLQTEEYARALFSAARLLNAEDLVAARMTRQQILERDDRARMWVVLDENVLRRVVGGRAVMARQLHALVEAAEDPRTVVQVIPYEVGAHASMDGPFVGLTMSEGADVVYIDGRARGHVSAAPQQVADYRYAYDLLRADALPPKASIELIAARAKELS